MPELPEVHTTVTGIQRHVVGHTIKDVWSGYDSAYFKGKDEIKDRKYFMQFRREVMGAKVIGADRRAKNILIHLSNKKTILIHMKMTGHLLYGRYKFSDENNKEIPWVPVSPSGLKDPYNRHIRLAFILDDGKHLALCDSRKFAKVTLIDTNKLSESNHLKDIGPEPLHKDFTFEKFSERMAGRAKKPIKLSLMDQSVVAGIGNIYADESLWRAGIHPLSITSYVPKSDMKRLYTAIRDTLSKGIDFGGDSMSDYRNIHGERGKFQEQHNVYQRKGEKCTKKGCKGVIERIVVGARGTHLCSTHQTLYTEVRKAPRG